MNWKLFSIAAINILFIVFPYNIIGCGPESEPYDEYISFFRNDLSTTSEFRSFYYINDLEFYDPTEADTTDRLCAEWVHYTGRNITIKQAHDFICSSDSSDIQSLAAHIGNRAKPIAASIRRNPMTAWLRQTKDTETVQYILFAKRAEGYAITGQQGQEINGKWVLTPRDSVKIDWLIATAIRGYYEAKKNFIRTRYAYQAIRLAFYNHHPADCIRIFDTELEALPKNNILYTTGLSYKAGALMQLSRLPEAAYGYSRSFALSRSARISNFRSFGFCADDFKGADRSKCISFCRNDREKADLLALFALSSNNPEAAALRTISHLSASSSVLEVLACREVNKIEQNYFSPVLQRPKGGRLLYYPDPFKEEGKPSEWNKWTRDANMLVDAFHELSTKEAVPNKALYESAASYLAYITKQYDRAETFLVTAERMPASPKVKDQQAMIRLLLTITTKPTIDSTFEAALLPSIQWLEGKAKAEGKGILQHYYDSWVPGQWQRFYRNLLSEVLAKRYHQQGNVPKELLCIGKAEKIMPTGDELYPFAAGETIAFMHNGPSASNLVALYRFLNEQGKAPWDDYLCGRQSVSKVDVALTIAASHLQAYNFHEAEKWLTTILNPKSLHLERNPFGDPLLDRQDTLYSFDKGRFSKANFAHAMAALTDREIHHRATAADLYKLATGYYNMTYYGRAWETVKFERPANQDYGVPANATPFQKEYYGCFTAERYYRKAMNASHDASFKARCLFMIAKCAQKRIDDPARSIKFVHSIYFPELAKEYSNTPFFREAFNTCSYLRDFVKRGSK